MSPKAIKENKKKNEISKLREAVGSAFFYLTLPSGSQN